MRGKKFVIYCILFIVCHLAFSQANLVPNTSFEDTIGCPNWVGQINKVTSWYSPTTGTPDYYNKCCTSTYCTVPNNWYGNQASNVGVAYIGIISFSLSASQFREYIQVLLNDSLKNGRKYHVEFYVSLADSMNYACNNIGAYFSVIPISSNNYLYLPYTPQVSNPDSNLLTDKISWTEISGNFIANGGEKYITIGNFKNDANSDTLYVGGPTWSNAAYYFVDDVSVIEDTAATGLKELSNEKEKYKIKLYPNPNDGTMQMDYSLTEGQTGELIIYNMMGEKINTYHLLSSKNNIKISEAALKNGVYFYQITIDKQAIINDKIVIIK